MWVEKLWQVRPDNPEEGEALARSLGLTRVTAQLLLNRGVCDSHRARKFFQPDLKHLHDPAILPEFELAAERIRKAVERREQVVVYGDYDVDGITATAILLRALRLLGARANYYVPDRLEEGYGLNANAVRKLAADGMNLLVTVDCGISAGHEVAVARELGVEVIITDHHEPSATLPEGAILINPKLPGSAYPFRELSGAGVAFKLAWAMGRKSGGGDKVSPAYREFLVDAVSLAALGTIADVVPLRDENRTLAHFGLRMLGISQCVGIRALCDAAGLGDRGPAAVDVAFKLAPRLNAAGRMGSARAAVELLTTDDAGFAREIALGLNAENVRRQKTQEKILNEALEMIEAAGGIGARRSIVLAAEGWHAGVVGIVAARLAETFCRPAVLMTLDGEDGHGSARSIGSVNLFEALQECAGRLKAFGGHARAAGLRMSRNEVDAFIRDFEKAIASRQSGDDLVPVLNVDAEVSLAEVTRPLIDELRALEPFGEGNSEPVLVAHDLSVFSEVRRMGSQGKHLGFWVKQNNTAFRAVAFGMGEMGDRLTRSRSCSLAFTPGLNRWNGLESIQLSVRDIKLPQ